MSKRQSGFTLVEIAIVLVIIGLLLGGVLKGQEMIANAKYKRLRSDVQAFTAAYYTFQDRYGQAPGDFNQASTRLSAAAVDGNGNGAIAGNTCTANNEESCLVWSHLRYADLLSGDPSLTNANANPRHPYGAEYQGIYGSQTHGNKTGMWLAIHNLPSDVARRLDDELDDGAGGTGAVFCAAGCTGGNYPGISTPGTVDLRVLL